MSVASFILAHPVGTVAHRSVSDPMTIKWPCKAGRDEPSLQLLPRGWFNGRPLVQWTTRPLGGWALEASGPRGPRKA